MSVTSTLVVVSTVVDDRESAERMARTLVEERLAACVQVTAPVSSTYRWKGRTETASEWGLQCKTAPDRAADLMSRIRTLHPYDLPELLSATVAGDPDYVAWVTENTTPHVPPS